MQRPVLCLFAALAVLACVWPSEAKAQTPVLVLPVDGADGPGEADEIIGLAMTSALEQAARETGREPTVSRESRDSIAAVAGCPGTVIDCIDELSTALGVGEVLFGEIESVRGDDIRVRLVHLAVGRAPLERRATVSAGLPEEIGIALVPEAVALLEGEGTLVGGETDRGSPPRSSPAAAAAPTDEAAPEAPSWAWSRVGPGPKVTLIGGMAVATAGAAILLAAPDSSDDLDTVGAILAIGGGAVLVAGLSWTLYEARSPGKPAVSLAPTLGCDSVGVAVTLANW